MQHKIHCASLAEQSKKPSMKNNLQLTNLQLQKKYLKLLQRKMIEWTYNVNKYFNLLFTLKALNYLNSIWKRRLNSSLKFDFSKVRCLNKLL